MQKVNDRETGDNSVMNMQMVLIDKNKNERVRNIQSYSQKKGEDDQSIMFFSSPADVRNTGFLTYDYDDESKDDDQWLYLPALRKTKRIASDDKSGSFMGSDFSYSDMSDRTLSDYAFKILKESKVNGIDVWVIESKPKTKQVIKETGYKKTVAYVRKDNFVVIRGINWLKKGGKMKYFQVNKLEKIDGIWTSLDLQMTTKKGKRLLHKTILRWSNVKYNQPLDKSMFSKRRLEKGL
jgi:hypothetical protein